MQKMLPIIPMFILHIISVRFAYLLVPNSLTLPIILFSRTPIMYNNLISKFVSESHIINKGNV